MAMHRWWPADLVAPVEKASNDERVPPPVGVERTIGTERSPKVAAPAFHFILATLLSSVTNQLENVRRKSRFIELADQKSFFSYASAGKQLTVTYD